MRNFFEHFFLFFYNTFFFLKYRNKLPKESTIENPKLEYDWIRGGIHWNDEGLTDRRDLRELYHPFIFICLHRKDLVTYPKEELKTKTFNVIMFHTAKLFFPDWIGFSKERCSYNPELSNRIKRIEKVSDWKIQKHFEELERDEEDS
ncbi:hypothetical protein [Aureivirga marina]|uniref:hypothetical protein n=1 Tax=Aureivirga marina TaxID=1182451 RepID=UPI0018C9D336|nr:hypothetical protein [Aureivirga marina]